MIVKICGVRSLEDAQAAVAAGADMLGFNFYRPSPRYIETARCAQLVCALRQSSERLPVFVGVFVNAATEELNDILRTCGLDLAQLHGDEPPESVAALGGRGFKALRPASADAARAGIAAYCLGVAAPMAPDILLDASAPGLYGGSGQITDWAVAGTLAAGTRLMLAGGLHPDNVADAVAAVRPWGVDVASGIESAPGVKDAAKMKLFVERAKNATR